MNFTNTNYPGQLITFEGIDGAGKSTHIHPFAEMIGEFYPDKQVILTREPGGTILGEKLRDMLLTQSMDIRTEALLMFASRQEHIQEVILPALLKGDIVICDRFTDSSFAYQCGGRGLAIKQLEVLEQFVQLLSIGDHSFVLQPDLTLLFDLSAQTAQERRSVSRQPDKFEELDVAFFNRVRSEYLRRAEHDPQRFVVIDSSLSVAEIQKQLREIVAKP